MDTIRDAGTGAPAHATGAELLAVAEGDVDRAPNDAVVEHVFSCERCSASVRELRSSLATLASARPVAAAGPAAPRGTPAASRARPAEPLELAAANLPDADSLMRELNAEEESYARSRRLIVKVLLAGALLAIGMLWMRSFASGLH